MNEKCGNMAKTIQGHMPGNEGGIQFFSFKNHIPKAMKKDISVNSESALRMENSMKKTASRLPTRSKQAWPRMGIM